MIEEEATIISTEGDIAWVETQRQSTCGQCSANKGCGTATISRWLGNKRTQVMVLNTLGAGPGDHVMIGIREDALIRGSLSVYAMPLLFMIVSALLGEGLFARLLAISTETASLAFGLAGLGIGFLWLRRYSSRISRDSRYQPVVLRTL